VVVTILDTTVTPNVTTILSPALYTITGLGNSAGGTVIYPLSGSPLVSGQYLTINRNVPLTQTVSISNQGTFYPHVVEQGLDQLELQIQQLNTAIGSTASGAPAGGDLSGSYPNPSVVNLSHVTNGSVPNSGLANSTMRFGSQSVSLGGTAATQGNSGLIQLGSGSFTAGHIPTYDGSGNLIDSGASGGCLPSGSQYSILYNNSGGCSGTGPGTATYPLVSNGNASAPAFQKLSSAGMTTTGVTAGSYSNSNLTIDTAGRITAATNGSGGFGSTVVVSANNTCASDVTSVIQAALNTGNTVYLPRGCYLVSSDLTFTTKNQIFYGDGPGCYSTLSGICTGGPFGTVIYANAPGGFTHGVLYFNTGEQGPQVINLGISLAQPVTASRSALTAWVPAVYARATPRFQLRTLRLEGCITCIDMQDNSGGAYLYDLMLSGYGTTTGSGGGIVMIDGSEDTVRMNNVHIYNFDMPGEFNGGLGTLNSAIFYNAATIGISIGQVDNLYIDNVVTICGTGAKIFYGTSYTPGIAYINITNTDFDSFNGIVASGNGMNSNTGPQVAMANVVFSQATSANSAINASAGNFTIAGVQSQNGNVGSVPMFILGDSTGTLSFQMSAGWILNAGNDMTDFLIQGDAGTNVQLSGLRFQKTPSVSYNDSVISVTGSSGAAPRVILTGNSISDRGTSSGSASFISVAYDAFNIVTNNSAAGWALTFPTATYGIYTCNTVGASPACGTSTGSGTITGVTAGNQLSGGGTTGTVTLNVSATPAFTNVNSNTYNDAAGNSLLAVSGGQTSLGNSSDGSVLVKTSIAPNGAGFFLNGTSTNYWSAVWGAQVGAVSGYLVGSGSTPGVTCSGTPTSSFAVVGGIVTHC